MPNSTAATISASQVSTNVSSRAATPIRAPDTVTIIFRLPIRSEMIAADDRGDDHAHRVDDDQDQQALRRSGREELGVVDLVAQEVQQVQRAHRDRQRGQEPGEPGPGEVRVLPRADPVRARQLAPGEAAPGARRPAGESGVSSTNGMAERRSARRASGSRRSGQ